VSQEAPLVIDDETVQRVTEANRARAELEHLTARLHRNLDFARDPKNEKSGYTRLVERRNALLETEALPATSRDYTALELQNLALGINDRLATPWQDHIVPPFADRSNQLPDDEYGTTGYIESFSTSPGEVIWAGSFRDTAGIQPEREKWWHRTWSCPTLFPAAPFKGWLHYRFDLRTQGQIYYAPVDSGAIKQYVCLAKSSDATQPLGAWETVSWPLDLTLPFEPNLPGGGYAFSIPAPVYGSIPVEQGAQTALGFILGTILGFANGGTDIAGVSMRPSASGTYRYGRIEYRFIPNWWIAGITEHFNV